MGLFSNLFRKKKQDISIHENLSGDYFYHIAVNDIPLCGDKKTMRREIGLESWGTVIPHRRKRYCEKCEQMWINKGKLERKA